ncbi:MAG TPA: RES family NAD+ phosphorylase [Gemmatimonadales bacterium]|nr:RES family NAD+ phosphorylase [Gemmatimonadales bacterium]
MIVAWRLSKTRYSTSAFDGEGARLNGGRWNSVGRRVAYASESVALAALEVLVGLQDARVLSSYSLIRIEFPDELAEELDRRRLPETWRRHPPLFETQRIGDLWVAEARTAVLKVPSAIVEVESNYLFNPNHPGFAEVTVRSAQPFCVEQRLIR